MFNTLQNYCVYEKHGEGLINFLHAVYTQLQGQCLQSFSLVKKPSRKPFP